MKAGVRHFKVATTREAALLLETVDRLLAPTTNAGVGADDDDGAATAAANPATAPPPPPRIVLEDIPDPDPLCPTTSWPAVVDVLVAYPLVGPALRRAGQLAEAHPRARLSVLVECAEAARELPPRVGCFVDVNPGMNRTAGGRSMARVFTPPPPPRSTRLHPSSVACIAHSSPAFIRARFFFFFNSKPRRVKPAARANGTHAWCLNMKGDGLAARGSA